MSSTPINSTPGESTTSSDIRQELTIGIEIEFLATVPDSHDSLPDMTVHDILRRPVTLACPHNCNVGKHDFILPVDHRNPPFWQVAEDSDHDYTAWVVARDASVRLSHEEQRLAPNHSITADIELQSRIMHAFTPTPCPHGQYWPCTNTPLTWTWQDEVTAILTTLQHGFAAPDFRVLVNKTCGIHVHVGRGGLGFSLDTTKNVMAVFTAYERLFDSITPADRIAGTAVDDIPLPALQSAAETQGMAWPTDCTTSFCTPLSTAQFDTWTNRLVDAHNDENAEAFYALATQGAAVPQWLDNVYATTSIEELIRDYSILHSTSVNIEHLAPDDANDTSGQNEFYIPLASSASSSKKTIEIRLHAASLEKAELLAWLDLLTHIVTTSANTPCRAMQTHLVQTYADPSLTLVDLATHVNATDTTISHYAAVLSTQAPEYAMTRFNKLTTPWPLQRHDQTRELTDRVEYTRLLTSTNSAISTRMMQKLLSGRYGQFPLSFLRWSLPVGVWSLLRSGGHGGHDGNDGRFLRSDMSEAPVHEWSHLVDAFIGELVEKRLTSGSRGANVPLDNLFDDFD
jgi:hypothetical protein